MSEGLMEDSTLELPSVLPEIAIIYRIQRKEGGARKQMPPRGFTHLMHSVAGILSTRNKTSKTVAATGNGGREEETKEAR